MSDVLDREPTRWQCSQCKQVNRALRPICSGCGQQRWEQFGFTLQQTAKLAREVYEIHKRVDVEELQAA